MSVFQKATKSAAKLRLALQGPSGSGKTYSALEIARHFGRVAVGDTEYGSASKYAHIFDFDVCHISEPYSPEKIGRLIKEASEYDVLVIDSMTHFWNGEGGLLSLVDAEAKKSQARGGKYDSFGAWKSVDPIYKKMVSQLLAAPMHIIMTVRAKAEHVIEEEGGKKKVRKLGMKGEMRDDFVFALDCEGMMNQEHQLLVGKTRCPDVDGKIFDKPGEEFANLLKAWLTEKKPEAVA